MKRNLTLIIRDNDTKEDTVIDVEQVHYQFDQSGSSVRVLGYLPTKEEITATVKIKDCSAGHSYVLVGRGLLESYYTCEKCGITKDEP
jgi:hypothetical protein